MKLPPLLSQHPRSVQILLAVVLPGLYGALTGYVLGVSETTYLVLSVLGIVGGIGAGIDHLGAKAGARRGLLGGFLFGGAILLAHEIHGAAAKADLPHPAILLIVLTTCLAALFGAIGGTIRARSMPGLEPEPAPEVPGPLG